MAHLVETISLLYSERSSHVEESTQKENQQFLREAQKEIQERDEKLDDLRMEYESKLKVTFFSLLPITDFDMSCGLALVCILHQDPDTKKHMGDFFSER